MNDFLNKLQRKIGKYAIPNLTAVLMLIYVIGYSIRYMFPNVQPYLTLNPYMILHGQVWRIVSWILIPPESLSIFTIIMLFFYYSIGTVLERTWGSFRYNVYIISGLLFMLVGAFVLYGFSYLIYADDIAKYGAEAVFKYGEIVFNDGTSQTFPPALWQYSFSTYYINMTIFLAFAVLYPEMQVLLAFIIPVKVKWMGYAYGVVILYDFIICGSRGTRVVIICSLLNFLIFFLSTGALNRFSPKQIKRRQQYKRAMNRPAGTQASPFERYHGQNAGQKKMGNQITRHKCAICGRTELDDESLEFRFCSKCDGNYEYCSDHLYTHEHVTQENKVH